MLLKDKRIFYIEDDVMNVAVIKTILDTNGAKCAFERWGGSQTLVKLHRFAPVDLILLDLMLPHNVTGYDVFDAIRADEEFADVPVIIVSAADAEIEIPKARRKGINGYISKPVDVITLPKLLARFFDGKSVWIADSYSLR